MEEAPRRLFFMPDPGFRPIGMAEALLAARAPPPRCIFPMRHGRMATAVARSGAPGPADLDRSHLARHLVRQSGAPDVSTDSRHRCSSQPARPACRILGL